MANVLVTGATGFVGGHLVEALVRRGDRVRCLVRNTSNSDHLVQEGVDLVMGDVRVPSSLGPAVADVDVVYHSAGVTAALRVSDLMAINTQGVAHLAAACAACARPPVHVLVSSIAAAGPTRPGQLRREEDPSAPTSHYGRSKRGGELAAEKWAHRVPTTVVRPGIILGPRNRDILPAFQSIDRMKVHFVPTWAPSPLSFIHVDDFTEILIRAANDGERIACQENGRSSGKGYYFACVDEYPSYLRLGKMIAEALGRRHFLPLSVDSHLCWVIGGTVESISKLRGRTSQFSIDKMREVTAGSWACSNAAIQNAFGFQPPLPLAARLREDVQWYRQHGWL